MGEEEEEQREAEIYEEWTEAALGPSQHRGKKSQQTRRIGRQSEWKLGRRGQCSLHTLHTLQAVGPGAFQAQLLEAGKARVPSLQSIFCDPERAHVAYSENICSQLGRCLCTTG